MAGSAIDDRFLQHSTFLRINWNKRAFQLATKRKLISFIKCGRQKSQLEEKKNFIGEGLQIISDSFLLRHKLIKQIYHNWLNIKLLLLKLIYFKTAAPPIAPIIEPRVEP